MSEPYIDAEGFERRCELCGSTLVPNVIENFWIHGDDHPSCSAATTKYGMRQYNRPTAETIYVGKAVDCEHCKGTGRMRR